MPGGGCVWATEAALKVASEAQLKCAEEKNPRKLEETTGL